MQVKFVVEEKVIEYCEGLLYSVEVLLSGHVSDSVKKFIWSIGL